MGYSLLLSAVCVYSLTIIDDDYYLLTNQLFCPVHGPWSMFYTNPLCTYRITDGDPLLNYCIINCEFQ